MLVDGPELCAENEISLHETLSALRRTADTLTTPRQLETEPEHVSEPSREMNPVLLPKRQRKAGSKRN